MDIVQSYLLYYFIVISSSLLVALSERTRKKNIRKLSWIIFWAAILLPVFISAIRYGIGTDYFSYQSMYFELTHFNLIDNILNTRFEIGWITLNHLVDFAFGDVKYLFVLSSILLWFLMFKGIYQHKDNLNLSLAVLILLTTMYNMSFNNVRQSIAIAIVLVSLKYLIENKNRKFIITILFAALFHYTTLILLPIFWIVNGRSESFNKVKKTVSYILILLFLVFAESAISLVSSIELFSAYGNYNVNLEEIGFRRFILKLPIIIFIILNIQKLRDAQNPLHKLTTLYFIGIILEFLRYFAPYLERLALNFEVTQILLIPAMIKSQDNKYLKFIMILFVVAYYLMLFTYQIILLNNNQTIPYQWKW